MKRLLFITIALFSAIGVLFTLLFFKWERTPNTIARIYVLDKTVSKTDYSEHKSFFWVLNSLRIVKPGYDRYQLEKDYYGFYPIDPTTGTFDFKSIRISQIEHFADSLDMAYYVDCYGVYSEDWNGSSEIGFKQKIYGGLNQNDYLLLKALKEKGKPIIAEYNLFSNLGSGLVRNKVASLLGFSYTGWIGRSYEKFDTLAVDGPPRWLVNLYQTSTGNLWPNGKGGIAFVGPDGRVVLLYNKEDLKSTTVSIISNEDAIKKFNVSPVVPFKRWFEVIDAPSTFKVYSTYFLDLTPVGVARLQSNGIPTIFPATIYINQKGPIYYFAGNFARTPSYQFTSFFWNSNILNHMLASILRPQGFEFFNNYYCPMMTSILTDWFVRPDSMAIQRKKMLIPLK